MTAAPRDPEPPRPERAPQLRAADLAAQLGARLRGTEPRDPVRGITLDSRTVRPGDLWSALPGASAHGADFAAQAASRGAVAALTDPAGTERCRQAGLTVLEVADPRALTATAAAAVHGQPAQRLSTIGVTGTNGKTSVTTMLHQTLLGLQRSSGVIGTSGTLYRDTAGADHAVATVRTTPEAPEVQGILARMAEAGVQACSMEVSSHALALHRADAIVFDAACFTNLSQDHLDFHGDMESYYRAKARLFTPQHARHGVICVDDEAGRRLAREATVPVTTYSVREGTEADVTLVRAEADGFGTRFTVRRADGTTTTLRSPLPGRHYVANTIAVVLLLETVGIHGPRMLEAVSAEATVPGRMELVADRPVRGIVDYSHTPDAITHALVTVRAVPETRRIIAVIGAGGNRDTGKRPLMGLAAARIADVVIVTDDNPRSEDPAEIRRQVIAGIPADCPAPVHEIAGRRDAIDRAAELADVGDAILVAGKGSETGQEIGGIVHPFDDRDVLRGALTGHHGAADLPRRRTPDA